MYKRIVWPALVILTIVLTIAFGYGFSTSVNITASQEKTSQDSIQKTTVDPNHQENDQSVITDPEFSILLVLGDSIGAGIGDENGEGIGEKYANLILQNNNKNLEVVNLSVPGAKTHDLIELIDKSEIQNAIREADVIFLSIGGNDLKKTLSEESISLLIDFEELLIQYIQDISKAFQVIDELNSDATIVAIGLYNPYGEDISRQKVKLLLQWNYETQNSISLYPNFIYTPTYDLFQYHLDSYLALDDFHPNTKGYQMIAERIYKTIPYLK